ncbi:MAG: ATP-dependent helicase [Eubacteriales bacterium]|jgi:DNA helicase-2/ATP-dependent DNA helicase PcrA
MEKGQRQALTFEAFKLKYDIRLNPQQERAVRKTDGPALLLAVPGSGKTTVITTRVAYLIFCVGVPPEQILTLTFSRAAAAEMKDRFSKKFGAEVASRTNFSTIHSFCYSVIRKHAGRYGYSVPKLVTDNSQIIRKLCISAFYQNPGDIAVRQLLQYVGYCKNRMVDHIELEGIDFDDLDFRRFFETYESYMCQNDLMDFDDQLLLTERLIENHPDLLAQLQNRYRYINVDEAQDNSYLQHKIISRLSSRYDRLFMVGDEDQSIYGFRAAYPEALVNFRQNHPKAEILLMETNYRCCKAIADAAQKVIRGNQNRYEKEMDTVHDRGAVIRKKMRDSRKQYRYILRELRKLIRNGKQVAVLYRNNTSGVPLFDLLDREGVPFTGELDADFFENRLVEDFICALRLAIDPRDLEAYSQIYWKLGLFTTKLQFMRVVSDIEKGARGTIFERLATVSQEAERIFEFGADMAEIGEMAPYDAIENLNRLFYSQWTRQLGKRGIESIAGMEERLLTLLALAAEQKTIESFLVRLRQLKALSKTKQSDCVTIATIHQSKGMEFDKVFLIDLYRGILPSDNNTGITEAYQMDRYEEEIRLFYVALTRARYEVEVITAPKRFGRDRELSPFVDLLFSKPDKGMDTLTSFLGNKPDKETVSLSSSPGYKPDKGVVSMHTFPGIKPDKRMDTLPSFPVSKSNKRMDSLTSLSGSKSDRRTVPMSAVPKPLSYHLEHKFRPGVRVMHKYFGTGIIINRIGDTLAIRFDKEGDKRMLLSACLKWRYIKLDHPDE